MATKKEIVRVCDVCSKEARTGGEMWIGGHPFNGWFTVSQHGGSTTLDELRKKREWDICSAKCLSEMSNNLGKYQ